MCAHGGELRATVDRRARCGIECDSCGRGAGRSATEIRELANARWTVRLGHGVFTKRRLDSRTMSRAVETFVQFRNMLDRYGVAEYSAVATSAVREAANRDALVSRILREAGIELTDHRRRRRGAPGARGSFRGGGRKVCSARHH